MTKINYEDLKLTPEMVKKLGGVEAPAPTGRSITTRQSLPPAQRFTCPMDWHREILWENRADGATWAIYMAIVAEDFKRANGKRPYVQLGSFDFTSKMVRKAGVKHRDTKSRVLRQLERWGIILVERPNGKNTVVTLLKKRRN
jgi:hypothetical protein